MTQASETSARSLDLPGAQGSLLGTTSVAGSFSEEASVLLLTGLFSPTHWMAALTLHLWITGSPFRETRSFILGAFPRTLTTPMAMPQTPTPSLRSGATIFLSRHVSSPARKTAV